MEWYELRNLLAGDSKISHERRPKFGYARIEIDLGLAEYVGTNIPLAFSGDQISKILYTGSTTGTYFRLNNKHAQQIYASEFKRTNIPFTKMYLTNPAAQSGKKLIFFIGTGVFASVQASGSGGAGGDVVGLTNAIGAVIDPAEKDSVDAGGDLQKIKEELEKILFDRAEKLTTADQVLRTATGTATNPNNVKTGDAAYAVFDVIDEYVEYDFEELVRVRQYQITGKAFQANDGEDKIQYYNERTSTWVDWVTGIATNGGTTVWVYGSPITAKKFRLIAVVLDTNAAPDSSSVDYWGLKY